MAKYHHIKLMTFDSPTKELMLNILALLPDSCNHLTVQEMRAVLRRELGRGESIDDHPSRNRTDDH